MRAGPLVTNSRKEYARAKLLNDFANCPNQPGGPKPLKLSASNHDGATAFHLARHER
jgi:hypothetical protein